VFDIGDAGQGIVHVIGPELGITQPGMLLVCADSHSCTHGGVGAMAWGIGASEATHVLATQTIRQQRPATMRVTFDGTPSANVSAKDLVMYAIGRLGVAAGRGHAVEWTGRAVTALPVEQRLTLCNMSIEMGAKIGMIAPTTRPTSTSPGARSHPPAVSSIERSRRGAPCRATMTQRSTPSTTSMPVNCVPRSPGAPTLAR